MEKHFKIIFSCKKCKQINWHYQGAKSLVMKKGKSYFWSFVKGKIFVNGKQWRLSFSILNLPKNVFLKEVFFPLVKSYFFPTKLFKCQKIAGSKKEVWKSNEYVFCVFVSGYLFKAFIGCFYLRIVSWFLSEVPTKIAFSLNNWPKGKEGKIGMKNRFNIIV